MKKTLFIIHDKIKIGQYVNKNTTTYKNHNK